MTNRNLESLTEWWEFLKKYSTEVKKKWNNIVIWLKEPTRVNFWPTVYMLKDPYQTHRDFDKVATILHLQLSKLKIKTKFHFTSLVPWRQVGA